MRALEKAYREARLDEEREHVTPYLYRHPELFPIIQHRHDRDLSGHRWTVDTPEDLELVGRIFESLYPSDPCFRMEDVLELLERNPHWLRLNAHVEQKKLRG